MMPRLAASEASFLNGCGLDFAYSGTRPQAAAADSLTGRLDKQPAQLRNCGVVASTLAIVNQFRSGWIFNRPRRFATFLSRSLVVRCESSDLIGRSNLRHVMLR